MEDTVPLAWGAAVTRRLGRRATLSRCCRAVVGIGSCRAMIGIGSCRAMMGVGSYCAVISIASYCAVINIASYCAVINITRANAADTHMAGLISDTLPVASLINTKLMKPKAMPRVME